MRDLEYSPIVIDIETAPLPNAAEFLEPVQPAKNLRDPEKIAEDIRQRTEEQLARCSLDWNVGRIAVMGWWTDDRPDDVMLHACLDEAAERDALAAFWRTCLHRPIVGFNIRAFDLPFLIQRSRYLDVVHRDLDLGRYAKHSPVVDLYEILTFYQGKYDQGAMRRTLTAFAKRFGLPVDDGVKGSDVPALIAAGRWSEVLQHCRSDVMLTRDLAALLHALTVPERTEPVL